jgi:hypothetical protein
MSLSIRTVVSKKVNNKVNQLNNRMVEFNKPIIYYGDANVEKNLTVYGNEDVKGDLTVGGNLTVDGNLSVQDLTVRGNEQVNGNVNVTGTVLANTFFPGQVINMAMLSNTDLGQTEKTVAAAATTNIFSLSYTPRYSNSYLILEYQSVYYLNGAGTDQAYAYLKVNSDRISQTYHKWLEAEGGGARSGVLFPLIGRYTNTNTTTKTIAVDLYNGTDADPITVNSDLSTWLKITEIAR